MQIIRDGITYELSEEEMIAASEELIAIRNKKQAEKEEEWHRKDREWDEFQDREAKLLPYPINLLLSQLLDWREGTAFLNGTQDYKDDITKGLLWAISTLPEQNRLAVEYWYRDKVKLREGGALLGCRADQFRNHRDYGIRQLRKPTRFKAIYRGYKEGVEGRIK